MGIISKMNSFEKNYPLTLGGFIIAIISFLFTIFYNNIEKPNFYIQIDNEINLIDIKENIKYIKLLYKDNDLLNLNKEIKIIYFSLKNAGSNILQTHYDAKKTFSIKFEQSSILGIKIINSNSEYLKNNILPQNLIDTPFSANFFNIETNTIQIEKLIFDKDKFVSFKIYLLQPKNINNTKITVDGKIAGIEEIPIKYWDKNEKDLENNIKGIIHYIKNNFWATFFCIYFLLGILYIFFRIYFNNIYIKQKKKKVDEFIKTSNDLTEQYHRIKILNIYAYSWQKKYLLAIKELFQGNTVSIDFFSSKRFYFIPEEIFIIKNDLVELNEKNKEFIINFLKFTNEI